MHGRLLDIVEQMGSARVGVIGDVMLDSYYYGNAERLSPEAPVPVLHYQREDSRLGGAGLVGLDLAALGMQVSMFSVVGPDETGGIVRTHLQSAGIDAGGVLACGDRPTTRKLRLVGLAQHRHPQQMMRIDYEDASAISMETADRLLKGLEAALPGLQALCVEDYNKGLLHEAVCREAIAMARRAGLPVFVDPAWIGDYGKYRGASTITPNRVEAERATGLTCLVESHYQPMAERLLEALELEAAVLTLDRNGAYLAARDGQRSWCRTRERRVYNVAGAGDMFLAMLTAARLSGATWEEAVHLGNIAGGLECEKFGAVPISRAEVIADLLREGRAALGKQRSLPRLLEDLKRHRDSGQRIVFTNGCFDLIHLGHVKYFQFARQQGDLLVVGVNTDASIRRLKGPKRPIINEDDRISVLEELESIDYLVRFDEDTPLELIRAIQPDVLVKGADYTREQVVGWNVVEARGGRVALAPLIDGRSTSSVIQRILDAHR